MLPQKIAVLVSGVQKIMNKTKYILYLLFILLVSSCSGRKTPGDMVYIPVGEFIMGSDGDIVTEGFAKEFGVKKGGFYEDAKPARKVFLKAFYIDKYEVTNKQYKTFIIATGNPPPPTWTGGVPKGKEEHPVINVTWFNAHAYCVWAKKRLPTEEEWEKAARGPDGNIYTWGNEYKEGEANLDNKDVTMPVGSYKTDKSYYGVYDMGGNVTEWVDAWYEPYPGSKAQNNDFGKKFRVLRGDSGGSMGHYNLGKIFARTSFRQYNDPNEAAEDGGFRCAKSANGK